MKLILTRHRQQSEAIDGRLTIDGQFVCDTAERASTPLKAGSYHLHIGLCKKLKRKMLLLERCTSCCESCPMLKHGNGISIDYSRNIQKRKLKPYETNKTFHARRTHPLGYR